MCKEAQELGIVEATWDELPNVVEKAFKGHVGEAAAKTLATIVRERLDDLKGTSFDALQSEYTYQTITGEVRQMSMYDAEKARSDAATALGVWDPSDDPASWLMTPERLLALYETSQVRASDVRAFLYHSLRCNGLFHGDGYTRTSDNKRGMRECLAPNLTKEQLGEEGTVWASCTLGVPTVDQCLSRICDRLEKLQQELRDERNKGDARSTSSRLVPSASPSPASSLAPSRNPSGGAPTPHVGASAATAPCECPAKWLPLGTKVVLRGPDPHQGKRGHVVSHEDGQYAVQIGDGEKLHSIEFDNLLQLAHCTVYEPGHPSDGQRATIVRPDGKTTGCYAAVEVRAVARAPHRCHLYLRPSRATCAAPDAAGYARDARTHCAHSRASSHAHAHARTLTHARSHAHAHTRMLTRVRRDADCAGRRRTTAGAEESHSAQGGAWQGGGPSGKRMEWLHWEGARLRRRGKLLYAHDGCDGWRQATKS